MKLKNLKIGQRLTIGFGMAIAVMVVVILFGAVKLVHINRNVEVMVNERYPQTALANGIKSDLFDAVQTMRDILFATDQEEIKTYLSGVEQSMEFVDKSIGELNQKPAASPDELEMKKGLVDARDKFTSELERFKQLVKAGDRDQAKDILYTTVQTAQVAYFQALNQLITYHADAMVSSSRTAIDDAKRSVIVMIALAGGACVLAVMIGLFVTRSITRPLRQAVELAKRVAAGDLTATIEVTSQDETGMLVQSLKEMNESLARIVADVRTGIEAISIASAEIATGNMDLASRTEQQAGSVERTVASMEGLTSTVKQNADNARQANQLAATASQVATKGGDVVGQVVETMESINESARKIVDIISVIDGIAFQTNILALNAAVEAARAGEQGRGFAVVAAEVRSLAQRSAGAAKEIKQLIGDSVDRVNAGSKLVGQAGTTMDEVVTSVQRVTDIIVEISAASAEQSTDIEQINQAFTQIDEATNQNAALVEEAAAAAERMREEAGLLACAVSVFRVEATNHQPPAEYDVTPAPAKPEMLTSGMISRKLVGPA
ncbi:methyl-accepting chemotaxis protein [Noviherbaspirillum saxi]|uniref:HAMP domain-containing protein n=1 Tax=Noviherbaspirillum saxi TaxID=2320863 RepID=A0A3A3FES4_9BURK|nr:methyl-accepting chemotaxis protein [Noviherbaspirillum saxi]RJF91836.1 HAMP domain-containing protein [Noviherbaspirillum saxi]